MVKIKQMIKKISKALLVASLLVTGFVMNPLKAHAEDAQPYASAITITYKTFSDILSFGTAGSKGTIELNVKMKLATDSLGTTMTYYSSSCTPGTGTTNCSIYHVDVHSYANYTSSTDSNFMIIDFYLRTLKSGTNYYTKYRYIYQYNKIDEQYVVSGPSTTILTKEDK